MSAQTSSPGEKSVGVEWICTVQKLSINPIDTQESFLKPSFMLI